MKFRRKGRKAASRKVKVHRKAAHKRRKVRAFASAPKRRVSARRNPKRIMQSPAVEIAASTLAGVALGVAADAAPNWSWMPNGLRNSHVAGVVLALGGWKLAKGPWRQRLIAAGIGAAAQAVVRDQVAPALSKLIPGSAPSAALPYRRGIRALPNASAPMRSAQSDVLAANGLIR